MCFGNGTVGKSLPKGGGLLTAFIPARSGSKRYPRKNIRILAGKPLFVWTLLSCSQVRSVDRIVFSTDSQEYWELAKKYVNSEKLILDLRSPDEAGDNVKIFDYLVEAREKIFIEKSGRFILCLPTMPLRTAQHIEEVLALSERTGRAVFSAVEYEFATSFGFTIDEQGEWCPLFPESPMITGNTRTQDQINSYHPNGAIYLRYVNDLYTGKLKTLYQDALPYVMDRSLSVDIDTEKDFRLAEYLIQATENIKS